MSRLPQRTILGKICLFSFLILATIGLSLPNPLLLNQAFFLFIIWLWALTLNYLNHRKLSLSVNLNGLFELGVAQPLQAKLSHSGHLARFALRINGEAIPENYLIPSLERKLSIKQPIQSSFKHRGTQQETDIQLYSEFPFSLFSSTQKANFEGLAYVLPPPFKDKKRIHKFVKTISQTTHNPHHFIKTNELLGIREYQTGDPLKSIHWKASSRLAQLVSKEYEAEKGQQITLQYYSFGQSATDFEESLSLTRTLLAEMLQQNLNFEFKFKKNSQYQLNGQMQKTLPTQLLKDLASAQFTDFHHQQKPKLENIIVSDASKAEQKLANKYHLTLSP